jgi:hypothetical protein
LTIPGIGRFGPLGQITVDAQNGSILEEESTPCEEIEKEAERLAQEEIRVPAANFLEAWGNVDSYMAVIKKKNE